MRSFNPIIAPYHDHSKGNLKTSTIGSNFYLISKTWKRRDFSSVHSRFQFSRRACPVRRRLSLDQTDNYGVMITRRFKRCKKSLDNQLWSEGDLKDIKREIMNFSESRSKKSMQSQNIRRNLASASSIQRKKLIFWQIISKILDADLKIIERLIICSKTFDSIGLLQESFSGLGSLLMRYQRRECKEKLQVVIL